MMLNRVWNQSGFPGRGLANVVTNLRYGENPHQKSCMLVRPIGTEVGPLSVESFVLVEGGDPSGINITDLDRICITASRIGAVFEKNLGFVPLMALGVKHGNTCGAAVGGNPIDALKKMLTGDEQAISGGVVLVNFPFTEALADIMNWYRVKEGSPRRVYDVVIAPSFTAEAIEKLAREKTGKCRLLVNPAIAGKGLGLKSIDTDLQYRQVRGGFLVQDPSTFVLKVPDEWKDKLNHVQHEDLMLAWAIGSTSDSNTIVLVKNQMLIGRGVAQPSRVFACKVAVLHALESEHDPKGAVAYSDSFFPFPDGPLVLAEAGVAVIFATSGSVRDEKVRAVCAEKSITLLQLPDAEAR